MLKGNRILLICLLVYVCLSVYVNIIIIMRKLYLECQQAVMHGAYWSQRQNYHQTA